MNFSKVFTLISLLSFQAHSEVNTSVCADEFADFYSLVPGEQRILKGVTDQGETCSIEMEYSLSSGSGGSRVFINANRGMLLANISSSTRSDLSTVSMSLCSISDSKLSIKRKEKSHYGWGTKTRISIKGTKKSFRIKEVTNSMWQSRFSNKINCNFQ